MFHAQPTKPQRPCSVPPGGGLAAPGANCGAVCEVEHADTWEKHEAMCSECCVSSPVFHRRSLSKAADAETVFWNELDEHTEAPFESRWSKWPRTRALICTLRGCWKEARPSPASRQLNVSPCSGHAACWLPVQPGRECAKANDDSLWKTGRLVLCPRSEHEITQAQPALRAQGKPERVPLETQASCGGERSERSGAR